MNRQTISEITTFVTLTSPPLMEGVNPVVMVEADNMPQVVPDSYHIMLSSEAIINIPAVEPSAVALYHQLRREFEISHTEMSNWLGVKRRSLYNWMKEPVKATKLGPQIEERLATLSALREEMEPEHRPILFKIAFSPIYGDPKLGEAILAGTHSKTLTEWYEKLFSQFESYRSMHFIKNKLV